MILKFRNNTFLENPIGAKLVGLKRDGYRPVTIEFDYFDLEKLLKAPQQIEYLLHVWRALAPHSPQSIEVEKAKNVR